MHIVRSVVGWLFEWNKLDFERILCFFFFYFGLVNFWRCSQKSDFNVKCNVFIAMPHDSFLAVFGHVILWHACMCVCMRWIFVWNLRKFDQIGGLAARAGIW